MKRRTQFRIIMIPSIIVLLTVVASILGSVASTQIPQAVTPYLPFVWPVFVAVTLALIGFTLWWNHLSKKNDDPTLALVSSNRLSPPLLSKIQSREELLQRIYTYWITGKLEPSLGGVSPLSLGLKEQPDAVANPFEPTREESKQPGRLLPPETFILQIYDEAKRALLILGEPGSGKTILMLQLAQKLQARAFQKEAEPMPVVFELSSWSGKEQSLTDWILEEMKTKYNVPHDLSQSWINDGQIALLLDGLDGIPKKHRRTCIKAINAYRQKHYGAAVVVSTRSAEYRNELDQLHLLQAIEVQPFEKQQLDEYLSRNSQQLAIVGAMLREDSELRKMVTTPLALAVLRRVYHGKSVEDLLTYPLETRRHHIAETYFQYMFEHRKTSYPYTSEKTKRWLAWLAEQIKLHQLTSFSIERMRPTWLPDGWLRRLYLGLNWGLVLGLVMGGLIGLIIGLIEGFISSWDNAFLTGIVILLIAEFIIGLFIGPLFGVVALPHVHLDGWLQRHSAWLVELGEDKDVSLWQGAPAGVLFIGATVISTLGMVALVVCYWLLIALPQNFILFIKQNPFLSSRPLGISISVLIVTAYVIFIIYYYVKIFKNVVKLISRVHTENEEIVEMWFDKTAYALLCLFLYFAGCLPLNYPRFLNYAAEYTLLHKIQAGSHPETESGYTFVHSLLLEYCTGIHAADTYFQKGCDFRDLDREEEALQAFDQALHFSPHRSDIHYYKGKTLFTLKRYEEALRAFEQAIHLDPDDSDYYYFWKGKTLRYLHRYEEALLAFDQAIHLDPDDSDNYYWKGKTLDTLHRYEEALQALDQAIRLDPKDRYAYNGKADILFSLKRYEEALQAFDRAIRLDSDYATAYSNKGYALYRLNRYKEALAAYEQAIHLDPDDSDNYYWKGMALRCLDRHEEALQALDQAIRLDPNDSGNYYWKGIILSTLKRYEEALPAFDQVVHLDPKDPYAYTNKGRVLYVLHHYKQALSVLDDAIRLDPKLAYAYRIRSKIYLDLERSEEAKRDFEEAQKLLNEESELQDPEKTQKLIGDKK
jgi:tetratricopeptide (TPR) repeat protein